MTGDELKALRDEQGLDRISFAHALGYQGKPANLKRLMRRYEKLRDNDIPESAADRVRWVRHNDQD